MVMIKDLKDFKPGDKVKLSKECLERFEIYGHTGVAKVRGHTLNGGLSIYIGFNKYISITKKYYEDTNGECIRKYEENEKSVNMNYIRLLEEWENKNYDYLNECLEKDSKELFDKDAAILEIQSINKKILDSFTKLKEKYNLENDINVEIQSKEKIITLKTKEALIELEELYTNKRQDILNIRREVEAAISICENEESLRKVLIAYNIIDKNGKIKVQ